MNPAHNPRYFARPLASQVTARVVLFSTLVFAALGLAVGNAQADNKGPGRSSGNMLPRTDLALYKAECTSCHLGYAPGFLPAQSWLRMMGGLEKHYGTDASLDAAAVKEISNWLVTNAGTYKRVAEAPPEDRMTRSAWFERKHRKIDTPQVWKHTSVKSAANCMACHTTADKGNYNDNSVQFPKGLDERFRAAFLDD